ncbi:helix-turn-helix domain-containing protein [Methylobacterium sp. J-030]|uniref:helix-turn-helix domain-containing protein n=1 Tax=Methylobacterium sp. J-030 TaxID=2836627 RepID=UPI001FBB3A53|nr:helix-turn-helix transcriptional regulator [Methylobacterium sp. J-030]MCJ2067495.1 helix-turn-helix domain-containing protein [Methylobacterium sp. J-030]
MSDTLVLTAKRRRAAKSARVTVVADTLNVTLDLAAPGQPAEAPIEFEAGSGNVFADLGLPEAGDEAIKARLVMRLHAEMDRRGLNQTEFAKVLGVKQPDVSNLLRGRVLGFSLERMFEFTRALGDDVEITLRPSKVERRGRMSLKVA